MKAIKLTASEFVRIWIRMYISLVGVMSFLMVCFLLFTSYEERGLQTLKFQFLSTEVTVGEIQEINKTNITVNDRPVIEYIFTYQVAGNNLVDSSYAYSDSYEVGEEVPVDFIQNTPDVARITGMQTAKHPFWLFLALLVGMLVIAVLFVRSFLRTLNLQRMLRTSGFAMASLKSKIKTKKEENDRPVYALTYEFSDSFRNYEFVTKTTCPEDFFENERVLFNAHDPNDLHLFIKHLPEDIRFKVLRIHEVGR
ncbi:MAG: hypothetical protein JJ975_03110 [Bacteroidia bacterium]|nr:hypothetical protein [Bacteroidia bacterium]